MKRFFICILVILFSISVTSQPRTKEDYLRKSKNQRTWAWILTSGGIATFIGGVMVVGVDEGYFPTRTVGSLMILGGGAATTGGIILFSASKRNEIKGNEMMVFNLKMEKTTVYTFARTETHHFPALSLSVRIK